MQRQPSAAAEDTDTEDVEMQGGQHTLFKKQHKDKPPSNTGHLPFNVSISNADLFIKNINLKLATPPLKDSVLSKRH